MAKAVAEAEAEALPEEGPTETTEILPSTTSKELPPLPAVETEQLYAREKSTEVKPDGKLVTTLTYKTPTQAFSEQHH